LAQEGDRVSLADFVQWSGGTVRVRDPIPPASKEWLPELSEFHWLGWRRWSFKGVDSREPIHETGDLVGPAKMYVQDELNGAMEKAPTKLHLLWRNSARAPELAFWPFDLWGAILLQFVQAVDGTVQVRRCIGCNRWFKLGQDDGARRADAQTCSNSCRVRAHRLRQAALQMRRKRMPAESVYAKARVNAIGGS
jgi:hypothetical protein